MDAVRHIGGCHCKRVRFEVIAAQDLEVYDCNCSVCAMKRNTHFIVPRANFTLTNGQDELTEYTFNTHQAKHLFCRHCGVQAFYIPRSNPDGYAVTVHCIDPSTIKSVKVVSFDGANWESAYASSDIADKSKSA